MREGLIAEEQLKEGLAVAKTEGFRIGYALVKQGFVQEEELTRMLSKQYRVPAVDLDKVTDWAMDTGWQTLLNTRGTTWKGLPEVIRESVTEDTALALMVDHPALIKRPVIETGAGLIVGFKGEQVRDLEAAL